METVENHCEDVPFDMEVYVDQAGNAYQYGFGMNWSGKIQDERMRRYTHVWKKEKEHCSG
jgi:beta-glucosidase